MHEQKETARPRETDSAKVIQVIQTTSLAGRGTPDDPSRLVTQHWDFDGCLIAKYDPHLEESISESLRKGGQA